MIASSASCFVIAASMTMQWLPGEGKNSLPKGRIDMVPQFMPRVFSPPSEPPSISWSKFCAEYEARWDSNSSCRVDQPRDNHHTVIIVICVYVSHHRGGRLGCVTPGLDLLFGEPTWQRVED